jgi:hypothetical protein
MMEDSEKPLKKQIKGRFQKGQSGNPRGRPEGGRNRATHMAQTLLDGEAESLARKVVELALAGDVMCLRICLERLVPPRKDAPIHVVLPEVESIGDLPKVTEAILQAVAEGEVTPSEAESLVRLIDVHRKTVELADIESRLSLLETIQKGKE